jgi:hypothetical protein
LVTPSNVTVQKSLIVDFVVKMPSGGRNAMWFTLPDPVSNLKMTLFDFCEVNVILPEALR